ncbi:MAG: MMPL family transporter [Bacteroidales bacterium]|nr:MMPL family transporter [Bacteroidales bacterium]
MVKKRRLFKHRLWYIAVPVVLALCMVLPLTRSRIDTDLMTYLPSDFPSRKHLDSLEAAFGSYDPLLLVIETEDVLDPATLGRLTALEALFEADTCIGQVISLMGSQDVRGEAGNMVVDPAVPFIPTSSAEREALRTIVQANPLVYDKLVSTDFNLTLKVLNPVDGCTDEAFMKTVRSTLEAHPGKEHIYLGGLPVLRHDIQRMALRDLLVLMPIGLIIMLLTLYVLFKERKGVLLPFSVVCLSVLVAMGLIPLMGNAFSMIAVLIPVLMIAIANNYGVHLMTRYYELRALHPRFGMKRLVGEAVDRLTMPIWLTGLTTMVGVLGLLSHPLLPPRQMAIVVSAGILFAVVASLTFLPAVLSGLQREKRSSRRRSTLLFNGSMEEPSGLTATPSGLAATSSGRPVQPLNLIGKLLHVISTWVTHRPKVIVTVFVLLLMVAGAGLMRLKVNINLESFMPAGHEMRTAVDGMNQHLGGAKTLSIVLKAPMTQPAVLNAMDTLGQRLQQLPGVHSVTSLATVVKTLSKAMNEPDHPWYDRIPDQEAAIAQYLALFSMSGDPAELEQVVDMMYTQGLINVQFRAETYRAFKATVASFEAELDRQPYDTLLAGQSLVEMELAASVVKGLWSSLLLAFGSILLLLWLLFKSPTAGLMGGLPLVVALIGTYGLMGWFGLELDIATSLLSSIAIGLGVDYTIHLFWRVHQERDAGLDWNDALSKTLTTTGRGIMANALSVMAGFLVLFLSSLTLLKAFGFLILFSLLLCLLAALLLVPAVLKLRQPSFLSTNKPTNQ